MSDTTLFDDPSLLEDELDAAAEIPSPEDEAPEGTDQGEDGGQGQGQTQQEGGEQSRVGRRPASDTIRETRRRAQEAERQLAETRERMAALERAVQARNQPSPADLARQQQERADRLAMMAPHEAAQFIVNEGLQQQQQTLQAMQRQQLDALDRMEFRGLVASNQTAAKFADRVEKLVAEQAAQGYSIKREQALKYAIGEAYLAKAPKAGATQRAAAAGRVAANTVTRGAPGGDVAAEERARGNTAAARAKRLENMKL